MFILLPLQNQTGKRPFVAKPPKSSGLSAIVELVPEKIK